MTQQKPDKSLIRENRILSEPATPERCRADYEAGTADRITAHKQWRRAGGA
ncbi:hypothetical protein [Streptomyces mutabilis]|uniref:hypothetical protein n=1 Tax=Streptomyces mutabilis TaxID=67332 RepID=UPI000A8F9EA0|nr:hypothetical protein [Streptomyces mutabilis]